VLRLLPSRWSLVAALFVEFFDEDIFHRGSYVGEPPPDALVVADDYERHSGKGHACDIEASALQMRGKPQIRHLMVEVHIIRKEWLSCHRVFAGDHPIVRSRPEGVVFGGSKRGD